MQGLARFTDVERVAYQLGVRHFERGDDEAAIEQLTRLVATRPRFADVHYLLGLLYERRGDLEEATHRFEEAVALNPRYAEARLALATVCDRRGDFDRAEEIMRDGLASAASADGGDGLTQGKLANLQAALGDAYREAGELADAISAYRKALDRCPHFHDIRYRLAIALREHGLPDQAIRELGRVLRANPTWADASVQLGLVYWTLGQVDRAAEYWRDALRIAPGRADVQAYLRMSRREGAAGERPEAPEAGRPPVR
jgi:tetratricopeptide (TPR) repeat protein